MFRRMLVGLVLVARAAISAANCTPVDGAESVLRAGSVVLLGEIHGTDQAPDALSRLVCLALERDLSVTVGLEIPEEEQPSIDRYLEPGVEEEQRAALLQGNFWRRDYQDGRSSHAMLELLTRLRDYRRSHDGLRVVVFDRPEAREGRDAHMANRLRDEISGARGDVVLVLTGNIHNRLTRGTRFDPELEPMGYLLRRSSETKVLSLRITHSGGTAWICTGGAPSDCGARELQGQEAPSSGIELFGDDEDAYSGRYHVGKITASPPARETRPLC